MLNARELIGRGDVLLVTLDTLRYDVAVRGLIEARTPNLRAALPGGLWERRHTPGSFTYAAHHAFFAGFLPTPAEPGRHPRLFATRYAGSKTVTDATAVFDASDIVTGFARVGYHTVCIGGVGFFNRRTPLTRILPDLFGESHWRESFGVTDPQSTEHQVACAMRVAGNLDADQRLFMFVNISALHPPNHIFSPGAQEDSADTQLDALSYVDRHLPALFDVMRSRAEVLVILCSDHGTAYGEDGFSGHRLAHQVVWEVPYAEFVLPRVGLTA